MNQVQNGGIDSSWVELSARFVLSAPEISTAPEFPLIGPVSGCPAGSFTEDVGTNITTLAFIPKASPGLHHDR
jgi:hypothetical protein